MKTNPNENKMTLFYLIQSNLYTNCEFHDSRHGLDRDYEGLDRNRLLTQAESQSSCSETQFARNITFHNGMYSTVHTGLTVRLKQFS